MLRKTADAAEVTVSSAAFPSNWSAVSISVAVLTGTPRSRELRDRRFLKSEMKRSYSAPSESAGGSRREQQGAIQEDKRPHHAVPECRVDGLCRLDDLHRLIEDED